MTLAAWSSAILMAASLVTGTDGVRTSSLAVRMRASFGVIRAAPPNKRLKGTGVLAPQARSAKPQQHHESLRPEPKAMEPAIPVMAVIGAIAASVIVVRLASAFAKRLERRPPAVAPPDPAIGELRDALDAMQERLDFLERAVVAQRNQGGRALPGAGERAGPPGERPS